MGKFQVTLGEMFGGIVLLTITLGIVLPSARKMVEGFGSDNIPTIGRIVYPHVGVIVILIQVVYWASVVPGLRRWRVIRTQKTGGQ